MERDKIGIVGYGQFGEFISKHLAVFFDVYIFSNKNLEFSGSKNLFIGTEENINNLDYLIFSVPLSGLEEVCKNFQNKISKDTILIDVTSVKVKPLAILVQYFPYYQILGTHPIFGPQSGKDGIKNLPIVLTNVSLDNKKYLKIKSFLEINYKLNVIEKSAIEHDKEMAVVQGLSHFIGRVLKKMDIHDYETSTSSYKQLISLKNLVGDDTWDLYKTIQNGNPFTNEVRTTFLKELNDLENKLKD